MLRYGVLILLTLGVLPAQTLFFVAEGDGKIQGARISPLQVYAETPFTGIWVNETHVRDTILHIVSSGDATVYRYRADSLTPLPSWTLPSGSNPYSLAFHSSGSALITLFGADSVALVQGNTLSYAATGRSPEGVLVWGDRFVVVVTGYDRGNFTADTGGIYLHDATTGAAVDSFPRLCVNPQTGAVEGDTLWLLCTGDYAGVGGKLLKVLLLNGTRLDSLDLSAYYPTDLWQDPLTREFYVSGYRTDWSVVTLRIQGNTVQEITAFAGFSGTPYRDTGGVLVFLEPNFTGNGRLVVYDPLGDTLVAETPVGTGPVGLSFFDGNVVNPGVDVAETARPRTSLRLVGRTLMVDQPGGWSLEVLDPAGRRVRFLRGHGPARLRLDLPRGVYLLRPSHGRTVRAVLF